MRTDLKIETSDASSATEIANFFRRHVTREYLTHADLAAGRGGENGEWSDSLESIVEEEVRRRVDHDLSVVVARIGGALVAVAFLAISDCEPPHATLEDLLVDQNLRHSGVGTALLQAAETEAMKRGARELYLDCGCDNVLSQQFFTRRGYNPNSITFRKGLP